MVAHVSQQRQEILGGGIYINGQCIDVVCAPRALQAARRWRNLPCPCSHRREVPTQHAGHKGIELDAAAHSRLVKPYKLSSSAARRANLRRHDRALGCCRAEELAWP
jgi:hypothetical protein